MEQVAAINPFRNKLVDIVSKRCGEKVTIWVRKTLSLMIRKSMTIDNIYISNRVFLSIRNLYRYFHNYNNEEVGIFIAVSIYTICVELNILQLGDEIEDFDEFKEVTEESNWKSLTRESLIAWDLGNNECLYSSWVNGEQMPLMVLGVYSAMNVDAYLGDIMYGGT